MRFLRPIGAVVLVPSSHSPPAHFHVGMLYFDRLVLLLQKIAVAAAVTRGLPRQLLARAGYSRAIVRLADVGRAAEEIGVEGKIFSRPAASTLGAPADDLPSSYRSKVAAHEVVVIRAVMKPRRPSRTGRASGSVVVAGHQQAVGASARQNSMLPSFRQLGVAGQDVAGLTITFRRSSPARAAPRSSVGDAPRRPS
jgi:hypothetical protein